CQSMTALWVPCVMSCWPGAVWLIVACPATTCAPFGPAQAGVQAISTASASGCSVKVCAARGLRGMARRRGDGFMAGFRSACRRSSKMLGDRDVGARLLHDRVVLRLPLDRPCEVGAQREVVRAVP